MFNEISQLKVSNNNYPKLLKEIGTPPSPLFLRGSKLNDEDIRIAIVGTRKAKKDGLMIANKIAKELAIKGITIVSGLALGIDISAHKGAIEAKGKTLAVLGTSIDRIYPLKHEDFAKKIVDNGGSIISEYPSGHKTHPSNFLDRNRIISGLCSAVVIIESPIKSGSLSTAHHALDQGREVFVVPGSPFDKNYSGSHKLIREGARLVTSAENIIHDLSHSLGIDNINNVLDISEDNNGKLDEIDKESMMILKILEDNPSTAENMINVLDIEPREIQERLASMTINGLVDENKGKYYKI